MRLKYYRRNLRTTSCCIVSAILINAAMQIVLNCCELLQKYYNNHVLFQIRDKTVASSILNILLNTGETLIDIMNTKALKSI